MTSSTPLLALPLLFARLVAADPAPLLANGDFESSTDGAPTGWPMPAGASCERDGANHFLRLTAAPGRDVTVYRQVPVAGAKALRLTWRVRYAEVKRGSQPWHDARIVLDFKDADGKAVKPGPAHPFYTGTSGGWKEGSLAFAVPAGATMFTFMPALFTPESGVLDLDDVRLVAIPPERIPAPAKTP